MWWHTPEVPTLGRLKQEGYEFRTSLVYTNSARAHRAQPSLTTQKRARSAAQLGVLAEHAWSPAQFQHCSKWVQERHKPTNLLLLQKKRQENQKFEATLSNSLVHKQSEGDLGNETLSQSKIKLQTNKRQRGKVKSSGFHAHGKEIKGFLTHVGV